MCDGTGLAEALLGLRGFKVLEVVESVIGKLTVAVETMVEVVGCPRCGVRAEASGSCRQLGPPREKNARRILGQQLAPADSCGKIHCTVFAGQGS